LINKFIEKWEEGFDVVCGYVDDRREESKLKHFGAKIAFSLLNKCSDISLPENVVDYRLMSKRAVVAYNRMNEKNRYFRGISHWLGFKTAYVPYTRDLRNGGHSKTNILYLADYVIRAITSFSIKPLRFFLYFGFVVLAFAVIYAISLAISYFMGLNLEGFSTIIMLLLIILGILSVGFGVIGEYVGRIYIESKDRPLWIIDETVNLEIDDNQRYGGK